MTSSVPGIGIGLGDMFWRVMAKATCKRISSLNKRPIKGNDDFQISSEIESSCSIRDAFLFVKCALAAVLISP